MLSAALASLSKLNEWLEKAIYLLAIFIVANMVLALFLSALIRYVSGTGYDWFIELPPILTSWLVFPLLGPLLKSGAHIKVDILNNLLAPRQLSVLRLIIAVIALLSSIVFLSLGLRPQAYISGWDRSWSWKSKSRSGGCIWPFLAALG